MDRANSGDSDPPRLMPRGDFDFRHIQIDLFKAIIRLISERNSVLLLPAQKKP